MIAGDAGMNILNRAKAAVASCVSAIKTAGQKAAGAVAKAVNSVSRFAGKDIWSSSDGTFIC